MSLKPALIAGCSLTVVTALAFAEPIYKQASGAAFMLAQGGKDTPAQAPVSPPAAPPSAAAAGATRPQVDETALRYFAAQGDQRRLEAEIARLRALYPAWTPPENLDQPPAVTDAELDRIWKLYADGKFAEARAAVAERQTREPRWTPPADLTQRLAEAEARERLGNAAQNAQWGSVLRIAEETPGLLTCGDVGTMWTVAEAFAKTGRADRARDAYDYVLANCNDPAERLGTVQRAAETLDKAAVDTLLKRERTVDGAGEFESLREDRLRARVNAAAEDGTVTVPAEDIAALERIAREGGRADDALTLGFYSLRRDRAADAVQWFELARQREESPKAVEGLVIAMSQNGRALEAEPLAHEWRTRSPDNRRAYLDVVTTALAVDPPPRVEAPVLARMSAAIAEDEFAPAGQAMGFYALNIGQAEAAAAWFSNALEWDANDEPSAYGLALARQRLGERAAFAAILREWGPKSPRIARLGNPAAPRASAEAPMVIVPKPDGSAEPRPVADEIEAAPRVRVSKTQSWDAVHEEPAAVRSARTMAPAGRTSGSCGSGRAIDRGWCLMELNRPTEAITAFDEALSGPPGPTRQDAAYGKSLAQLRLGLTDAAAVAATQAPMSARRGAELQVAILTQRALAAYRAGRFSETIIALQERAQLAPEQTDLMMIRGWSYYRLRRFDDARRLFTAVARTGNNEGRRGLVAIDDVTRRSPGY